MAAIVLEFGGDEDQAVAALLHDAIEDQGGDEVRQAIRARFGDRVVRMVNDCTDAEVEPKPPWRERKETYLAHLAETPPDSLLISMAPEGQARELLTEVALAVDELERVIGELG